MKRRYATLLYLVAFFSLSSAAWSPSGRHISDDDTSGEKRTPSFYQTATDIDPAASKSVLAVAQGTIGDQTDDMRIFVDRVLIGTSSSGSITYADVPLGEHFVIFSFGENFFIEKYFLKENDSCVIAAVRTAGDSLKFSTVSKDSCRAMEGSGAYAIRSAKYANGNILMNQKFYDNLIDKFQHGWRFIGDNKPASSATQFKLRPRTSGGIR
jgi:hypothetical protein